MAVRKERVASRLAELRDEHRLSQEKAAAKVGVTMRQWQRWEAGESTPYHRNLEQIASTFGIQVGEFFEPKTSNGGDGVTSDAEASDVLSRLDDLAATQQAMLDSLLALAADVRELREVVRVRRQAP